MLDQLECICELDAHKTAQNGAVIVLRCLFQVQILSLKSFTIHSNLKKKGAVRFRSEMRMEKCSGPHNRYSLKENP